MGGTGDTLGETCFVFLRKRNVLRRQWQYCQSEPGIDLIYVLVLEVLSNLRGFNV